MELVSVLESTFSDISTSGIITRAAVILGILTAFKLRRSFVNLIFAERSLTPKERGIREYGNYRDMDFHQALLDGYANVNWSVGLVTISY
jgi:hypothetical protein